MVAREKKSAYLARSIEDVKFRIEHRNSNEELVKDAAMLPLGVTTFEKSINHTVRTGTELAKDAFDVFDKAYRQMMQREVEVEAKVKTHTAIIKDKANQVAEALARINKLAGPDFEEKLLKLERFAAAMDTLDRLNRTGKLAEVSVSLRGLSS